MHLKSRPFNTIFLVTFFGFCLLGPLSGCGSGSASEGTLASEEETGEEETGEEETDAACKTDADCESFEGTYSCFPDIGLCGTACKTDEDCEAQAPGGTCFVEGGYCA